LFQSLWHSVVFHTSFERHLTRQKYTPGDDEMILVALQQTWEEYMADQVVDPPPARGQEDSGCGAADGGSAAPARPGSGAIARRQLVPASDLAEAFGEGYGDMSEAFALVQDELSQSPNPAASGLAELMVTVPLSTAGAALPTPDLAWRQATEWQIAASPMIAVDLSMPVPTREDSEALARLWIPGTAPTEAD
jgi:hypothetical protein